MAEFKVDEVILNGEHGFTTEENYVEPNDEVKEKLEWFRDLKFALMVHMGLYTEVGITASWGLSDHDASWSRAEFKEENISGAKYREMYFNLNKSFNPIRYNPETWAQIAYDGGFKYLIFTTKHHDGFCLWDTKEHNFKTTSSDCLYHDAKYADIVKTTFDAFRKKGMGIAAYFSKPDWHSEFYWKKDMDYSEPTWRMTSYNPLEYPDIWDSFVKYTHNQLREIVTQCGPVDILWLDGGQVRQSTGLDIHLGEIVGELRKHQPDLIVSDRTVGGEFENYVTPEQTVPENPMNIPWESCITLGSSFTYHFDDKYKSYDTVIKMLIDVVCKGGNLALNVSPQPDGRMPLECIKTIRLIGQWLNKYGEAIYKTRICYPYKKENVAFTQNKDYVFAFIEKEKADNNLFIPYNGDFLDIELMNAGIKVDYVKCENGIKVMLDDLTDEFVLLFKIRKDKVV